MIYIEYCLSDGTDKNTEYLDNTHSNTFKSALDWMTDHFYAKHCKDDDYFWKCKNNSYYCGVTKEMAEAN